MTRNKFQDTLKAITAGKDGGTLGGSTQQPLAFLRITRANYDALGTKDPKVLYLVTQ